jgi:hypothetical protein
MLTVGPDLKQLHLQMGRLSVSVADDPDELCIDSSVILTAMSLSD